MALAQIHIWQQSFLADIAFVNILVTIITVVAYIMLALGTLVTAYSAYDYVKKAWPMVSGNKNVADEPVISQAEDKSENVSEGKNED